MHNSLTQKAAFSKGVFIETRRIINQEKCNNHHWRSASTSPDVFEFQPLLDPFEQTAHQISAAIQHLNDCLCLTFLWLVFVMVRRMSVKSDAVKRCSQSAGEMPTIQAKPEAAPSFNTTGQPRNLSFHKSQISLVQFTEELSSTALWAVLKRGSSEIWGMKKVFKSWTLTWSYPQLDWSIDMCSYINTRQWCFCVYLTQK